MSSVIQRKQDKLAYLREKDPCMPLQIKTDDKKVLPWKNIRALSLSLSLSLSNSLAVSHFTCFVKDTGFGKVGEKCMGNVVERFVFVCLSRTTSTPPLFFYFLLQKMLSLLIEKVDRLFSFLREKVPIEFNA